MLAQPAPVSWPGLHVVSHQSSLTVCTVEQHAVACPLATSSAGAAAAVARAEGAASGCTGAAEAASCAATGARGVGATKSGSATELENGAY